MVTDYHATRWTEENNRLFYKPLMMNIFTAFNEEYVLPTKVMLKSLVENQTDVLTIYVFYSSLSRQSIDSIRRFEESSKASFCFKKVDDSFFDIISIPGQFSKETYYRLFAHRIFPEEVERALWLDGDLIVNGPLSAFYNQEFQGKLFIAVENHNEKMNEQKKTILKMPLEQKYANTGVMLLNLREMSNQLIDQEIIQYLIENQDILSLADQDVFNGFLYQHLQITDPNHWYNYFHWRVTNENKADIYSKARIIHYCGTNKPWKENYSLPAADLWWEYALKTSPEYLKLFFETHCSKGELKNIQGELKNIQGELKNIQGELKNTQGKLKNTQGELKNTQDELKNTQDELKNTQSKLIQKCEELNSIKHSVSFCVGRSITWVPRKVRGGVQCYRDHGAGYTVRRVLYHMGLWKDEEAPKRPENRPKLISDAERFIKGKRGKKKG